MDVTRDMSNKMGYQIVAKTNSLEALQASTNKPNQPAGEESGFFADEPEQQG